METLGQPVPILRRAGTTGNPSKEVLIPGPQAGRLGSPERTPKNRLIVDVRRRRRRPLALLRLLPGVLTPTLALSRTMADWPRAMLTDLSGCRRFAAERLPVEREIRMRVLEAVARFVVERLAAALHVRR
jgi:hypothetical protein